MPPSVQNAAAQGQPQHMQYDNNMGYYDMSNGFPPLHRHRDHAGAALDVPAQAQAAPPADPVCADLTFPHTYI